MLDDDRKHAKEQDFDVHGHAIRLNKGSTGEQEADAFLEHQLCGWACKCFLTRLNFLIAGLCFTFVLYTLSETTTFFETISHKLTGLELPETTLADKSLERFLSTHYMPLCLFGPAVVVSLAAVFYLRNYSRLFNCSCTGHRSLFSLRCCDPPRREKRERRPAPTDTEDDNDRREKIRNR